MRHHLESLANAVAAIILSQLVLAAFGISFHKAIALNAVMFGVSYIRSYVLRRIFCATSGRKRKVRHA